MNRRKPTKRAQKNWKPAFLKSLALTDSPTKAAEDARINRQYAYEVREKDSAFRRQWDEAREKHGELLEAEAAKRAFAGSDTMLIFLLKNKLAHKYRDKYEHEYSGAIGVQVIDDPNWYHVEPEKNHYLASRNGAPATNHLASGSA